MRRDVLELIRAADVVCLTSEAEALPMSILEAMALGGPVVATDVGGTREAVVDGETGLLVGAGDGEADRARCSTGRDPQRARAMGAAGRRRQRERFAMARGWSTATGAPSRGSRPVSVGTDVLVSLGTTLGWRVADRVFLEQLERAGAAAAVVSVGFGPPAASGAATRSTTSWRCTPPGERRHSRRRAPRAAGGGLLLHHGRDAARPEPAVRGPPRCAGAHEPAGRAQRRPAPARAPRLRRARLALPLSEAAGPRRSRRGARGGGAAAGREPRAAGELERERLAVAYVPDPKAKGLDVLVAAWAAAALPDAARGVGLEPDWARSHLRRSGVAAEPHRIELWAPCPPRASARRCGGAHAYVAGARWEDFGPGAARGARRRGAARDGPLRRALRGAAPGARLAPLVAARSTAALGAAIRAAFELPDERGAPTGRRARAAAPFGARRCRRPCERDLLPRCSRLTASTRATARSRARSHASTSASADGAR